MNLAPSISTIAAAVVTWVMVIMLLEFSGIAVLLVFCTVVEILPVGDIATGLVRGLTRPILARNLLQIYNGQGPMPLFIYQLADKSNLEK